MAAKRGPTLIELIQKEREAGHEPLASPPRAGQPGADAPQASESDSSKPEQPPIRMAQTAALGMASESDAPADQPAASDSLLTVSITTRTAAVSLFVALGVLASAVAIGHAFGKNAGRQEGHKAAMAALQADAEGLIDRARSQPPDTSLVAGLLLNANSGTLGTDVSNPGAKWIRGYDYVMIQEFRAGRGDDAEKARRFLAGQGVEAELITFSSGSIQLISTRGFNRRDGLQADASRQFLARVHELGRQYRASGGGYTLEGYFKTFTGDRW